MRLDQGLVEIAPRDGESLSLGEAADQLRAPRRRTLEPLRRRRPRPGRLDAEASSIRTVSGLMYSEQAFSRGKRRAVDEHAPASLGEQARRGTARGPGADDEAST